MAKFCYSGPSNNAISQDTEGPPNFRFNQVSKHSRKTEAHGFELQIDRVLKEIFWCKIGSNITSQHLPFSFSKAKIEIFHDKFHITPHSLFLHISDSKNVRTRQHVNKTIRTVSTLPVSYCRFWGVSKSILFMLILIQIFYKKDLIVSITSSLLPFLCAKMNPKFKLLFSYWRHSKLDWFLDIEKWHWKMTFKLPEL